MNKNRVAGAAKTVSGRIVEKTGKAVGDQKTIAKGKAQKTVGKVQNAIGGLQDSAKKADRQSRPTTY
jgi:uncharacterized protein YjbJ (UPF0337 family)